MFVLASRQEAFPLSTLEAMAAGVPVVASAVGGIPEQIEHLETGILVPPGDPSVLSDWIVRLYDDAELRRGLAVRAHVRVLRDFSVRAQAQALGSAYAEAIEHKRRERPNGGGGGRLAETRLRWFEMTEPDRSRVERH